MNDADTTFYQLQEFLRSREVSFEIHEEQHVLASAYTNDTARFEVVIGVENTPLSVAVVVQSPLLVPEAKRLSMAEAIARINERFVVGHFDVGLTNGRLRFWGGIPLADSICSEEQFLSVLDHSITSMARYHRAFCRLLFDDELTPCEAVAEVDMT